jgi:hypothetical protein
MSKNFSVKGGSTDYTGGKNKEKRLILALILATFRHFFVRLGLIRCFLISYFSARDP